MSGKRLMRSEDRMIFGVCAGLADYMNLDPTIVRFVFALATILSLGWVGVLVYLILAFVMPEAKAVVYRPELERQSGPVTAKYNAFDPEEIVIKDAP